MRRRSDRNDQARDTRHWLSSSVRLPSSTSPARRKNSASTPSPRATTSNLGSTRTAMHRSPFPGWRCERQDIAANRDRDQRADAELSLSPSGRRAGFCDPGHHILGADDTWNGDGESLNEVPATRMARPESRERLLRFREAAGRADDRLICTSGKACTLHAERLLPGVAAGLANSNRASSGYARLIEMKVSSDPDAKRAGEAPRHWVALALSAEEKLSVEDALKLERLAAALPIERVAGRWIRSTDPDEHVDRLHRGGAVRDPAPGSRTPGFGHGHSGGTSRRRSPESSRRLLAQLRARSAPWCLATGSDAARMRCSSVRPAPRNWVSGRIASRSMSLRRCAAGCVWRRP